MLKGNMEEMHRQMVSMTADMKRMMKALEQMPLHRHAAPSKP